MSFAPETRLKSNNGTAKKCQSAEQLSRSGNISVEHGQMTFRVGISLKCPDPKLCLSRDAA